jgi:hypothetical protein
MTPAGWVMMIASLGFVLGLMAFCLRRVLARPGPQEPDLAGDVHLADDD